MWMIDANDLTYHNLKDSSVLPHLNNFVQFRTFWIFYLLSYETKQTNKQQKRPVILWFIGAWHQTYKCPGTPCRDREKNQASSLGNTENNASTLSASTCTWSQVQVRCWNRPKCFLCASFALNRKTGVGKAQLVLSSVLEKVS